MTIPVLQAMVLADHIYRDVSGKHIIAGTFSTILYGKRTPSSVKGPEGADVQGIPLHQVHSVGSPYLYLALVELGTNVPLQLKYVELSDADQKIHFEAKVVVSATDKLTLAEFIIPMPRLPVHGPGAYSLDIYCEGDILGSWRVWVREREAEKLRTMNDD